LKTQPYASYAGLPSRSRINNDKSGRACECSQFDAISSPSKPSIIDDELTRILSSSGSVISSAKRAKTFTLKAVRFASFRAKGLSASRALSLRAHGSSEKHPVSNVGKTATETIITHNE
jgi:hypothetical protein